MVIRVLLTAETLAWHRGDCGPSHDREPEWITQLALVRAMADVVQERVDEGPPTWWLPRHTSKRRHQIADATFRWRSRRQSGVGADVAVEADPDLAGAASASRHASLLKRRTPAVSPR
jgi:ketosteroid isomerase-like protein